MSTKKLDNIKVLESILELLESNPGAEVDLTFNKKDGTRETRTHNADSIREYLQTYKAQNE